jgi:hypothetical protein
MGISLMIRDFSLYFFAFINYKVSKFKEGGM